LTTSLERTTFHNLLYNPDRHPLVTLDWNSGFGSELLAKLCGAGCRLQLGVRINDWHLDSATEITSSFRGANPPSWLYSPRLDFKFDASQDIDDRNDSRHRRIDFGSTAESFKLCLGGIVVLSEGGACKTSHFADRFGICLLWDQISLFDPGPHSFL